MTANIKQPALNLRERLNRLSTHHHDADYVKWANLFGKNLLINGDKSISQEQDFSAGISASNTLNWIDGYYIGVVGVTVTASHSVSTRIARLEATTSGIGYIANCQVIESRHLLTGRTVTYTAEIRGNCEARVRCHLVRADSSAEIIQGEAIVPNEEWQTISMTIKLPDDFSTALNKSSLQFQVLLYDNASVSITTGDYFEVRDEQVEPGDRFTGFEVVNPVTKLAMCQRYFYKLNINGNNSGGAGGANRNTHYVTHMHPVEMRTIPVISNAVLVDTDAVGMVYSGADVTEKKLNFFQSTTSVPYGRFALTADLDARI